MTTKSFRGRKLTMEDRRLQLWGRCSNTDDPSACWEWQGSMTGPAYGPLQKRYGKIGVNGKLMRTHVLAWVLHHGCPVPEGHEIAHDICHNPPCCNPAHLKAQTHSENEKAKLQAGRTTRGERNGCAKLTEDDVRRLKTLRSDGWSLNKLAQEFGIAFQTASNICLGRRWAHVEVST